MVDGAEIDPIGFGTAAADYATHRAGFPPELFDRLERRAVFAAGDRALDLGTGTGTVARQLAERGCSVVGLDPDTRLTAAAAQLDAAAGVQVEYVCATAEATTLPSAAFDLVTAGQCWHWFDREAATAEVIRLLAPQGRLVIMYFDWIPLPESVVDATERLIEAHNPRWTMGGRYGMWPQWVPGVQSYGFHDVETFSFDVRVPYSHEAWRGRIRASAGITALDPHDVRVFDRELAQLLAREHPTDPLAVDHRVWAMTARRPA